MAKRTEDPQETLLKRARARWGLINRAWQDQRDKMLENLAFLEPENQWSPEERAERQTKKLPCITEDRITPIIHQIVNEFRQTRPSIMVSPVGDGADQETADVRQGIIRGIEYESKANYAYDTALESAVRCGMGFIRIVTEFESPTSFNQVVRIKRVPNPLCVYFDPACQEPDFRDAQDCFVTSDYTMDAFKEAFPDAKKSGQTYQEWTSTGNQLPDWFGTDEAGKKTIRVAEYFYKEATATTICMLDDGRVVEQKDVPDGMVIPANRQRKTVKIQIKWVLMTGDEILEERDVDGTFIPIVPMLGDELVIDTKRLYTGLVDRAKDPQRVFNYMKSTQVLTIAMAPKAPWVGAKGFMGNRRRAWESANESNITALEYEVQDVGGKPLPPPQRATAEPNIQAVTMAIAGSIDGIKATTGVFDASLGAKEADQSGVAIRSLQHQSNTGNFHFADNASRAIAYTGEIINDLIQYVYDTEREVPVVKPDETKELTKINGDTGEVGENGEPKVHRMDVGTFGVQVQAGPTFATKRAENVSMLMDLLKVIPNAGTVLGPLIVSQMDMPSASEASDLLKTLWPPELKAKEAQGEQGGQQIPPQVQQMMEQVKQQGAQAQQVIDQLTTHLHAAQDEIDTKQAELKSKEKIAALQCDTQLEIERMKLGFKSADTHLQAELQLIEGAARRAESVHDAQQAQALQPPPEAPAGATASTEPTAQPPMQAPDASEEMQ